MGDNINSFENIFSKVLSTNTNLSDPDEDESTDESSTHNYLDDSDFDEAFQNLLCPIEFITKRNPCEFMQYNYLKDLDSYLNRLKKILDVDSSTFIEAALVLRNISLIYEKRVDEVINIMIKLIRIFQACRINQTEDIDEYGVENAESNKNKKKEKKIKFYPSFESIKGQIFRILNNFDFKSIYLNKIPPVPKTIHNFNIKVENKYSKILPYILMENGENMGKKYDFMVNYPLDCDLTVNEEFDFPSEEDKNRESSHKYQQNNNLIPVNVIDADDIFPNISDEVIFDQTETDEVCVANAMISNPPNILNVSQIPLEMYDDNWATVINNEEANYSNKPFSMKVPNNKDNGVCIPTFKFGELCYLKLKSDLSADPVFKKLIHEATEVQQSNIKKKNNYIAKSELEDFDCPIYTGEFEDIHRNDYELEQPQVITEEIELSREDVNIHNQNQEKIMNELLEVTKRVQIWHDNLRPILEEEEKRTVFDVHGYGTFILNSFESKGEKRSFKELFGGLKQEEVARYFVSTLIMTNTNNLEIINSCDEIDKEIKVKFLKKERHHEELQIYIGKQFNQTPM